ncbi:MAG: hypothetical protein L6R38_004384 [Xanthoria sp. 2 TBL-2021]|nr:MAG: hypothetical protein L6R38_004384 [Xanthoria sp. 2 TBL-2021]
MPTSATPKLSNKITTPAPQASAKGLPAKDTELITRHIAKAMPKPARSETPNGSSIVAPQASTEGLPHVNTEFTDGHGAKAGSAIAESTIPSVSTLPDPLAPSKALQSTGTTSGLSQDIKALLDGQRADIDRIAADMKTMTASLDYLKFQQKTLAEHETARSPTALAEDVHVLTREQQLLAKSVAQLRTKTIEVEKLKEELESLKQRMQYIEDTNASSRQTASGSIDSATSVSRPEKQRRLSSDAQSDSVNVSGKVQKNRSPTLLGPLSAQASASRRTSAYSLPPYIAGNSYTYEGRDSEQLYAGLPTSDKDMTPENESFGIEEPQITSATKVAAQNRRRLSDSSSDTRPPTKKRGRPTKYRGKPDWNTKPISLNNHQAVLASDPEDDDYDPDKNTQEMQDARMNDRPSRPGLLRMPTPEWEKPDWEGPSVAPPTNSTRGRTTARRGVSGRAPLVDRDTARRRSSGHGNGGYVYLDSPQYWDDQSPMSTQADLRPDPFEKPRDSQGRLLRQNGKIDGRSLRHKRAREEKTRQAAVQQQLQLTSQDSKHVTEGQEKEMQAMGLTAPGAGQSFVDTAALQAARNPGAASMATQAPHQLSSTSNVIKKEKDRADENGEGGPSTMADVTAPRPQSDRHAALMKQMFPWR